MNSSFEVLIRLTMQPTSIFQLDARTHSHTHTLMHTYADSGSPSHANRWPLGDVSPLWQAAGTCRQTTCKCAPLSTRSLVNLSASLSLPLPPASSTIATARHNVQSVKSVKLILKLIR